MKKTKRILALIGAILLLLLYVVAFVATVLDHKSDMRYWKAAVAATIIIPVLIWAYSFVYRLLKLSLIHILHIPENSVDMYMDFRFF